MTLKDKEIARLMKVYKISRLEAEDLYEFDKNHTDSDEDAKAFLIEEVFVKPECVEEQFRKVVEEKAKSKPRAQVVADNKKAAAIREGRMEYIVSALSADPLFGEPVEVTNTSAVFVAADTGFRISVKMAKHKEQKVVSKEMKPKTKRGADGKMVELAPTNADLRAAVLHRVISDKPELFEAPSFAGSKVGYADRNEKYPFGSISLTHHKS